MSRKTRKLRRRQRKKGKKDEKNSLIVKPTYTKHKTCFHYRDTITIGVHEVFAGAYRDMSADSIQDINVIVPLNHGDYKSYQGDLHSVLTCHMEDFGGVPDTWESILKDTVIPLLENEYNLMAFCMGGHGRTGTFLASLIAILEPDIDDPVTEIRKRYCDRAVETLAQCEGIFKLKGVEVPQYLKDEFTAGYSWVSGNKSGRNSFTHKTVTCPLCLKEDTASHVRPDICISCSTSITREQNLKPGEPTSIADQWEEWKEQKEKNNKPNSDTSNTVHCPMCKEYKQRSNVRTWACADCNDSLDVTLGLDIT